MITSSRRFQAPLLKFYGHLCYFFFKPQGIKRYFYNILLYKLRIYGVMILCYQSKWLLNYVNVYLNPLKSESYTTLWLKFYKPVSTTKGFHSGSRTVSVTKLMGLFKSLTASGREWRRIGVRDRFLEFQKGWNKWSKPIR